MVLLERRRKRGKGKEKKERKEGGKGQERTGWKLEIQEETEKTSVFGFPHAPNL